MGKVTTDRGRKRSLNFAKILSLAGVFIVSLFAIRFSPYAEATAGINQQINFQARLLNSQGATVPDGNYNMEFKIYQDGPGTLPLTTEVLKWTETRLNNSSQGVVVKNGYFSVMLGSVNTALNSSVDFNQDTLWLSVNVANTNATCTPLSSCSPDGEMVPFKRLAANPYALNSGKLGGLTSSQYGQLATTQTFTGTNTFQPTTNISSAMIKQNSSGSFGQDVFSVQGSSSGNFIQVTSTATNAGAVTVQSLGSNNLVLDSGAALNVGPANATSINLGRTGLGVAIPATGVVAVSLTGVPAAATTSSLIQLTAAIASGSANGTYIGANPSSFSGDFENFQVNGSSRFVLNSLGDHTAGFTLLDGTTTTNGTSGITPPSTSLTLTSAALFDVGNYVQVNDTNCGGTGVNPCYAKITAKAGNVLTISPGLTWTTGKTVNEYHIPELGGVDLTQALGSRYGRGYFISGVATGNGTTYYDEGDVTSSLASFDLLNTAVTTLNIGGAATTIKLGAANSTITLGGTSSTINLGVGSSGSVSVPGNLSVSGTITGAGPTTGISGFFQRNTTTLTPATSGDSISTSGNIATTGTGTITSAGGASISSGLNNNSGGVTNAGSISGVGSNITGTAAVTLSSGASSALNLTGAAASTWDIGNNTLSLQTASNGAITTGTGLLTQGGNVTFSGTAARTVTGPSTGGLTETVASGPLTLSTTTSGVIAVNSAGALNLTGAAASTWDIGANNLSVQTTGNGAITTGTGLLTVGGNQTFSGTAARTITGPSTGGLNVTVASGPLSLSTTTSGTLTLNSAGAINLIGAAPSAWDVGANLLSLQTTSNGGITTGSGLLTQGGNLTFSGTTARTITGPATGGLTMNVTSGPLTVSTTASGTLAVTSAGALNLTGSAASTFDIGSNTLSIQTTGNGAITTGTGLVTLGGNLVGGNRIYAPSTSGTGGQGFYIRNSTPNDLAAFQALDLGGNTYSFFATNKHYDASLGWVDDGLGRTGSSFQIQNDNFNFYSFDAAANFISRFTVASGGNVGVGNSAPTGNFQVAQFTTGYGTVQTFGTTSLTGTGTNFTNTFKVGDAITVSGETVRTIATITDDTHLTVTVAFSTSSAGHTYTLTGGNRFTVLGNGNVGIGTSTPNGLLSVGATSQFQVDGSGNVSTSGTYNTNTFTSSNLTFGAAGAATVQSTSGQNLNITAGGSGNLVLSGTKVQIGSATTDTTQINLQLDSSSNFADTGTCDTTTTQGSMYYNTASNGIRACTNGNWEDLPSTGGLGLITYGVVPDSGSGGGDIGASTGATGGPCRVSWVTTTTAKIVQGCIVYSGGRKVIVADNTALAGSPVTGVAGFAHVCLTGTNKQPAYSATGTETANMPTWSSNNPVACLADIKVSTTAITNIYDTRTFTTSTKTFATAGAALGLGWIVVQGATANSVATTTTAPAAAGGLTQTLTVRGVVALYSGATSTTTPNIILVTGGPQWVKATTGAVGGFAGTSTTAGYSANLSDPNGFGLGGNFGTVLGVSTRAIDAACNATTNCQYSEFVNPIAIH